MDLKAYYLDAFSFNNDANRKMIDKIKELPDQTESVRYISHLINSQIKWMARIAQDPAAPAMSWWDPVYDYRELEQRWENSYRAWVNFIRDHSEAFLLEEVEFTGFDGGKWRSTPADIIQQLIYHSIHHRAQIQLFIRQQGIEPDFIDYIGTKYRKVE